MRVLVIGDADAVLGFSLAGMAGKVAQTAQEVREALAEAEKDPEIGVILVTDEAASLVGEQIDRLRVARSGPIVVEIPGPTGSKRQRPSLGDLIARATGVRV
jgi:V/A-type H+/Na+-transporting ATPase subunit F